MHEVLDSLCFLNVYCCIKVNHTFMSSMKWKRDFLLYFLQLFMKTCICPKKKKKQTRTKSLLEVALYCFLSILLFISFLFGYCIAATATNAGDMFVGLLI